MRKAVKRVLFILLACVVSVGIMGCSKDKDMDTRRSLAGKYDFIVIVNDDGTIYAPMAHEGYYDFSDWENIVRVSSGKRLVSGVTAEGRVMITGGHEEDVNVDDWRNIKMVAHTGFGIYGLKENGKVVYKHYDFLDWSRESVVNTMEAFSEVGEWEDIVYIDACDSSIAGVKSNGEVVSIYPYMPEMEEGIEGWEDIKTISVEKWSAAGLTNGGEVLWAGTELLLREFPETVVLDALEGAIKICDGLVYVAALMPDGKLVAVYTLFSPEDIGAPYFEDTDVVNIDVYDTHWYYLKEDGQVIISKKATEE